MQVVKDAMLQILQQGCHKGSNNLFHMSWHGLELTGEPQALFASKSAVRSSQLASQELQLCGSSSPAG